MRYALRGIEDPGLTIDTEDLLKRKGACSLRCPRGDRNVVAFSGLTTMGTF
jgi:hypothetical protein